MTMTAGDTSGEMIILRTCTNLSVTLHEGVQRIVEGRSRPLRSDMI